MSPAGIHVSVQSNIVIPGFLPPVIAPLLSPFHDFLAPPPAPTPSKIMPCVEVPVPVMWPVGLALQQNKLTSTVIHKFQLIMLDGHDCGYMIPHISVPPANLMLPIIIGFSSRKAVFSASTVKANGAAIGCAQSFPIPVPMMTCGSPVSVPTSSPPMNVLNNVEVGMLAADVFAGLLGVALSMLADYLANKLSAAKIRGFPNVFSAPAAKLLSKLGVEAAAAEVFGKALGSMAGKLAGGSSIGSYLMKTAAASAAGGAKIALTDEGGLKVAVGSSYAGGSVTYSRTADGKNQYAGQIQGGTPLYSRSGAAQHSANPDRTTTKQTASTDATPLGQRQQKSKTDYDASGQEEKTMKSDVYVGGINAAPEVGGAVVRQSTEVSAPGESTERSSGSFGGGGSPLGGVEFWGPAL